MRAKFFTAGRDDRRFGGAVAALAGPLVAALAAALLAAAPAGAIVNGTPVPRSDYPYFVEVGGGCGGALIAPTRVLTAAHCRETVDENPIAKVGPKEVRRKVVLRAMSPVYVTYQRRARREFPPGPADLMLLELDRPVSGVPLVDIAEPQEDLTDPGTMVETIGRGATNPDGSGQGVFRAGRVQIQNPRRHCADQLGTAVLRRWSVCTLDPRALDRSYPGPFTSACVGDSGGPLIARRPEGSRFGPAGEAVVVGTVSWGPSCGTQRDPEIYANAVYGRQFVLAARPPWAPKANGRPRVVGAPRVGSTVTCQVDWRVRPIKPEYGFIVNGQQRVQGPSPGYRIRSEDRGKRLSCDGAGFTRGGGYATGLSKPVRVTG